MAAAAATVLSLASTATAQTLIQEYQGVQQGDAFGHAIDSAGDIDGDGIDDLIVGAHNANPGGMVKAGWVRVYSGSNGALLYQFNGLGTQHLFGFAVAGIGDFDGDGVPDVAASAVHSASQGANYVRVFSGIDGSLVYHWSGSADAWFGYSLSGAGDVDGDGRGDVVVGMPGPNGFGTVQVRGSAFFGMPYWTFLGATVGDHFGYAVSGGGDANADGVPDVIVGAPEPNLGSGYARVFDGATGSLLFERTGIHINEEFGTSVSLERDIDDDGWDDFVVGGPGYFSGGVSDRGRVLAYSGLFGAQIGVWVGNAADDRFGTAVATADVNGDGHADVVAGAPGDDRATLDAGSVSVYSGLGDQLLFTVLGDATRDGLGRSVTGAGNVHTWIDDLPSYEDIACGAPGWGETQSAGVVKLHAGKGLFLRIEPAVAATGTAVTVTVLDGSPGDLNLLFLTGVGSVSMLAPLFGVQPFAFPLGITEHVVTLPASLSGLQLELTAGAQLAGTIAFTEPRTLTIL